MPSQFVPGHHLMVGQTRKRSWRRQTHRSLSARPGSTPEQRRGVQLQCLSRRRARGCRTECLCMVCTDRGYGGCRWGVDLAS